MKATAVPSLEARAHLSWPYCVLAPQAVERLPARLQGRATLVCAQQPGPAVGPAVSRVEGRAGSSSAVNCRVEVLELDAGILGREAPVHPTTGGVARCLPGRDLSL